MDLAYLTVSWREKTSLKNMMLEGGGLEILPERSAILWTWTIVDQIDLSVELWSVQNPQDRTGRTNEGFNDGPVQMKFI